VAVRGKKITGAQRRAGRLAYERTDLRGPALVVVLCLLWIVGTAWAHAALQLLPVTLGALFVLVLVSVVFTVELLDRRRALGSKTANRVKGERRVTAGKRSTR